MRSGERYSHYDSLAWFYDRYWHSRYHQAALPVLEKLLLEDLAPGACVLDLCCGTGYLARILVERGFTVIGIDGSEEMLRYARENVPEAEFRADDARIFELRSPVHAVISTFDSLNHILSVEELETVFGRVHAALLPGGTFVFDLNMEEAYRTMWQHSSAIVEPDSVCVIRGAYDDGERLGRTDLTMFRLQENWHRSDLTLLQRCYAPEEVRAALQECGFDEIRFCRAREDLGMSGDIATGRAFFTARR